MNYRKLKNRELVRLLAINPRDDLGWTEFVDRFHEHICKAIWQKSKIMGLDEGVHHPEDLAQEVYKGLVNNDCHSLRGFNGRHENSIYSWLTTISTRVILRSLEKSGAQKRQGKTISIDRPIDTGQGGSSSQLRELIPTENGESTFNERELHEEINYCLKKVAGKRRRSELYVLIFKCYLEEDMLPTTIAEREDIDLSWKRVEGIISEMRVGIRECLKKRASR